MAKTMAGAREQFATIVAALQNGELDGVDITRYGKVVARIVPAGELGAGPPDDEPIAVISFDASSDLVDAEKSSGPENVTLEAGKPAGLPDLVVTDLSDGGEVIPRAIKQPTKDPGPILTEEEQDAVDYAGRKLMGQPLTPQQQANENEQVMAQKRRDNLLNAMNKPKKG